MTNKERLLWELDNNRWEIMLALADLAEEQGDAYRAAGYRWLAKHKRWPVTPGYEFGMYDWCFQKRLAYVGNADWKAMAMDCLPGEVEDHGTQGVYEARREGLGKFMEETALLIGRWLEKGGR